jgi:hypothetical protein
VPAPLVRERGRPALWTREAVAAHLQAWLDAHDGIAPTIAQWIAAGAVPSGATVAKVCGSWRGAWEALVPHSLPRRGPQATVWSRSAILERLYAWAEAHDNHVPTRSEWAALGAPPSVYFIVKEFGSWADAWHAAVPDARFPNPEWLARGGS